VIDWLIDKSALVRLGNAVEGQTWADRIERGPTTEPRPGPTC
jgi:hypothetical protein